MPEVRKRKIVIASVLKPVDDTRMYEKIGQSLANTQLYDVYIIGFPSIAQPTYPGINFYSLEYFKRLSLERLFASWKVYKKVQLLKPDLLIITTHELLFPAVLIKLTRKCKTIYDVQENYLRNILFTRAFPFVLRPLIALYVRAKEIITSLFIDYYFLAEKGYERELKFLGDRKTTLEN